MTDTVTEPQVRRRGLSWRAVAIGALVANVANIAFSIHDRSVQLPPGTAVSLDRTARSIYLLTDFLSTNPDEVATAGCHRLVDRYNEVAGTFRDRELKQALLVPRLTVTPEGQPVCEASPPQGRQFIPPSLPNGPRTRTA